MFKSSSSPVATYVAHAELPVIVEAKRAERRRNRITYTLLGLLGGCVIGFVSALVLLAT